MNELVSCESWGRESYEAGGGRGWRSERDRRACVSESVKKD